MSHHTHQSKKKNNFHIKWYFPFEFFEPAHTRRPLRVPCTRRGSERGSLITARPLFGSGIASAARRVPVL
jgi:hypothetical protein